METLHRKRGMVKAKLTRLKTKIDQIQIGHDHRDEIEVYTTRLDEIHRDFEAVQAEIGAILQDGSTVDDMTDDEDFEDKYLASKITLRQLLRHLPSTGAQDDTHSLSSEDNLTRVLQQQTEIMKQLGQNSNNSQTSIASSEAITSLFEQQTELLRKFAGNGHQINQDPRVKLPIIQLPTFDGRTEEWKRFAETFQSLIHNNENINSVQKFQYLITSLSGAAAKVIESIELTEQNYAIAWGLLTKRYDDPRAIKKKHIQCLFMMPRVEKDSSNAIRGLVDYVLKHLRILQSMNLPTDTWDELIIHMVEAKLDTATLRAWEEDGNPNNATLNTFIDFLQTRCQILERIEARTKERDIMRKGEPERPQPRLRNAPRTTQGEKSMTLTIATTTGKCYLCQGEHYLYRCGKFLAMSVDNRIKEIQRMRLCINCLRNDHFVKTCKMGSCRECAGRHNTLCHRQEVIKENQVKRDIVDNTVNKTSNVSAHHVSNGQKQRQILMATAIVNAVRSNGITIPIRILLDSASEANFITQSTCNKLGVKRNRTSEIITGFNEKESKICQDCDILVQSRHSNFRLNIHCLVVPTITKKLPSVGIDQNTVPIPGNIKLADFEFYKPSTIDMLVGAEFFFDLLQTERIDLGENRPALQNSKFGWVIAGVIQLAPTTSQKYHHETLATLNCAIEHCETLNHNLERFWEIETFQSNAKRVISADERQCEEFFDATTTRNASGRYVVRLPFREDPNQLGESRSIAVKRLNQIERRFKKNKTLHDRYVDFMREYLELGHMSRVSNDTQNINQPIIYLPHHGVIKESSTTTKLRTVFDASSKTSSGMSLNDTLHVGPTLQSTIIEIIMRFRFHNVALTADMQKMYRQISIHPDDRDYQRILWRFSAEEEVQDFQLNTVTYGEASSAYLAIKCIRKLAEETKQIYPIAARIILDDVYVDDIMTGGDNVQDVIEIQKQLTNLLQSGGFELHKWCSSQPESLMHVAPERKQVMSRRSIDTDDTIKTLGLEWNPNDDQFLFFVQTIETATTKRQILSAISKFFDPLGLIGPILTSAKILMQETWRIDCNWDEPLPEQFSEKWERFRRDLNAVEALLIPRRVISCQKPHRIYLHGFCDASKVAYGACLYIQVEDGKGIFDARLLCSKARVAPIKQISIPRLELCSAVLLAHLITKVQRCLRIQINGIRAWSDSQVALCWIRGDIFRWKTFVANRVSDIVERLSAEYWNHVKSDENPADLISRGTSPLQLKDSTLWWTGPWWLREDFNKTHSESEGEIAYEVTEKIEIEERNEKQCNVCNEKQQVIQEVISRLSSLTQIERVLAYCIRYIYNLKRKPAQRVLGRLTATEIREVHCSLIKYSQGSHFSEEIIALKNNRILKSSSKLILLHPFIDGHGVIRVGGRLQHTSWSMERKHPIVLPAGDRFVRLIFEREHRRLLHASQLLLLSSIRQRYWPLKGRNLARQVCHACVWCARNNPRISSQIMGSLPSDRVRPIRAFTITGVDFAGPITTLVNKGRGRKTCKSYIALFVCFSTKAIHLEATSELTTAAFIAAFRRFISRRGRPQTLYSDNGTNFVGANRELMEVHQFIKAGLQGNIGDTLANERIDWKFIPPGSPHMGGLWEAGVKSCKYHLKRVMGNNLFTFEELITTLSQIEACLNSRPLSPMSTDPMDMQPLTPAHFLIGESLTGLPEVEITDIKINRLDRWQMIQRAYQDFWKRWAAEYVTNLQCRTKWKTARENLKINDLVIVKEENLPPLKWKLGRVIELHPGDDHQVRVVTVRTNSGNLKRSIAKLCKLPITSNDDVKN